MLCLLRSFSISLILFASAPPWVLSTNITVSGLLRLFGVFCVCALGLVLWVLPVGVSEGFPLGHVSFNPTPDYVPDLVFTVP